MTCRRTVRRTIEPIGSLAVPRPAFEWRATRRVRAGLPRSSRIAAHLFTTRPWPLGSAPDGDRTRPGPTSRARSASTRRISSARIRCTARRSSCGAPAIRRAATRRCRTRTSSCPTTRRSSLADSDRRLRAAADRRSPAPARSRRRTPAGAGWRRACPRSRCEALARRVRQPAGRSGRRDRPVDRRLLLRSRRRGARGRFEQTHGFSASRSSRSLVRSAGARAPSHWFFDGWASARDQLGGGRASRPIGFARSDLGTAVRTAEASPCSYRRDR